VDSDEKAVEKCFRYDDDILDDNTPFSRGVVDGAVSIRRLRDAQAAWV
jgi:hypothetical protein